MTSFDYWVLDGHKPRVGTHEEWIALHEQGPDARRVAFDGVSSGVEVSTVFLGMDHNWSREGPPILFETMIFRSNDGQEQWRYRTWDEAEAGHNRVVQALRDGREPWDDE